MKSCIKCKYGKDNVGCFKKVGKCIDFSKFEPKSKEKFVEVNVELSNATYKKLCELAKMNKCTINDMAIRIVKEELLKEVKK